MANKELEKELTKIYNRNKIVLNPTSYDLKGRVLITNDLHMQHSWGMDLSLIEQINREIMDCFDVEIDYEDYGVTSGRTLDTGVSNAQNINDYGISILYNDSIYMEIDKVIADMVVSKDYPAIVGGPAKKFDNKMRKWAVTKMDNYIIPIVLMSNKKSLIDIIQAMALKVKSDKVNDIRNFETLRDNLKEVLENKGTGLKINFKLLTRCNRKSPRMISMDNSDKDTWYYQASDTTCNTMYKLAIVTAIEILANVWQSDNLTTEDKYKIVEYLLEAEEVDNYNEMIVGQWVYDYFKGDFLPEVYNIMTCTNLDKRWEMLTEYYQSIVFDDAKLKTAHTSGVDYFPRGISTLITTALEYSYRQYLYGYTLTLINFCKSTGIDLSKTDISDSDLGTGVGAGSGLGDAPSSVGGDEITNTLGSLDRAKYSGKTPDATTPAPRGSTKIDKIKQSSELLDKALNFEESKYSFKVNFRRSKMKDISPAVKNSYETIAKSVKLLNTNLIRRIKEIKTYNTGGKHSGLSKGRLDSKRLYLYKQTKDIFYNNTYKIKESDLAFALCLDASGSMCGDGIENGKITMIVLHETLKALGINHCIATHTSYGTHQVTIDKFQPFKEDRNYTIDKCYDLVNIRAYSGNCDSGALYYMEKELSRVQNKDKICIMFSDGQPTECSGTELKEQIRHMEKNGIRVIGVGVNYESIKEYYPHYANGKNLKQMLNIVADILKEYVLEKAE